MRIRPTAAALLALTSAAATIAGAADATKVSVGTQVGIVGATPGAVWAPDQSAHVARIDTATGNTNRVAKTFDAGTEPNGLLHAYGALSVGDYGGGKLL